MEDCRMESSELTLGKLIKESKDVREVKRALSVKLVQSGMEGQSVSEMMKVSEQYVSKWKTNYSSEGAKGLLLGYQGSSNYLNESERNEIVSWISKQTQVSVETLQNHLEANYGVVYRSRESYYELLKAGGMSYHKSEKVNPKRDEKVIKEKREAIQKELAKRSEEIATGELMVLIEDEVHLLWRDVCGYVWGQNGDKIEVSMTNEKERQTYYGAVNLFSHQFHLKLLPKGDGECTVTYVE